MVEVHVRTEVEFVDGELFRESLLKCIQLSRNVRLEIPPRPVEAGLVHANCLVGDQRRIHQVAILVYTLIWNKTKIN